MPEAIVIEVDWMGISREGSCPLEKVRDLLPEWTYAIGGVEDSPLKSLDASGHTDLFVPVPWLYPMP